MMPGGKFQNQSFTCPRLTPHASLNQDSFRSQKTKTTTSRENCPTRTVRKSTANTTGVIVCSRSAKTSLLIIRLRTKTAGSLFNSIKMNSKEMFRKLLPNISTGVATTQASYRYPVGLELTDSSGPAAQSLGKPKVASSDATSSFLLTNCSLIVLIMVSLILKPTDPIQLAGRRINSISLIQFAIFIKDTSITT